MNEKTQPNKCAHALLVIDRSGSMNSTREQTIQSINSFLSIQKESDVETHLTLCFFNDQINAHQPKPIGKIRDLTPSEYQCTGTTALYDAIGQTITRHQPKEKELTLVAIMTDGMENASKEYSLGHVRKLIEEKTKEGWQFQFLGADLSHSADADDLGMKKDQQTYFKKSEMKNVVDDVSRNFNRSKLSWRFLTADELCLLDDNDRNIIVDTGSPISMSDVGQLQLFDDFYARGQHALLPMIQKYLSDRITGLMGMDILGRYDLRLRFERRFGRWIVEPYSQDLLPADAFSVEYYGGVPVVEAMVDGVRGKFFLDSGATISFLKKSWISNQPYIGEAEDFFPTLGIFSTDLYRCTLTFANRTFTDAMGVMPMGLEVLIPDWIDGIIGLNILKDTTINFGFKSNKFSLQ